jgi:hypothetical protein
MSLQDVPPQHAFWLLGGKTIKNILELARELKKMNIEMFSHHVNEQKNDFASWVEFCIKDKNLAILMRTTKNKERMAAIVERRIQELTTPVRKEQPKPIQPSIIRTKNITPIQIRQERTIIKTPHVTKLELTHKPTIVHTPHKTMLKLGHEHQHKEIYVHEVKTHHHSASLLIGHLVLGIVIGVAIAGIFIMVN